MEIKIDNPLVIRVLEKMVRLELNNQIKYKKEALEKFKYLQEAHNRDEVIKELEKIWFDIFDALTK